MNTVKEKTQKLIDELELIIHGSNEESGLLDCYDTYYSGCWNDNFIRVNNLKKELGYE